MLPGEVGAQSPGSIRHEERPCYRQPQPMEVLIVSFREAVHSGLRHSVCLPAVLLAGAPVIVGCGSSSSSSSNAAGSTTSSAPAGTTSKTPAASGATQSLAANAEGVLKFDKSSLTAKAGSVSIQFTNSSPVQHNLTVASASGAVVGATATFTGGSRILPLNLKPGIYKFYCSVPGHRAAGMEGTLTVH
jgi:plastocyanin